MSIFHVWHASGSGWHWDIALQKIPLALSGVFDLGLAWIPQLSYLCMIVIVKELRFQIIFQCYNFARIHMPPEFMCGPWIRT